MGLYDQLDNLDKTPKLAASEPATTVEKPVTAPTQPKSKNTPLKAATSPQRESKLSPNLAEPHVVKKRIINRASFEVFQDQYHVLRQVSLEAKLTGDDLSISEMVREALDDYIHRNALHP
jgi:hypothetical protein